MLHPSLLALVLLSSFEVEGQSTCPRPEQVEAHLSDLSSSREHRVELLVEDQLLRVRLVDERGVLLGERELRRIASCEELAEAAAVLVSAWTIELPAIALPALVPETAFEVAPAEEAPGDAPRSTETATFTVAALPRPPPAAPRPELVAAPAPELAVVKTERALHERSGRHELSLGFSLGVGQRITKANGVAATYGYWFLDGLGVQAVLNVNLETGYDSLGQVSLGNFVQLSDAYAPQVSAGVNVAGSLARGPARLIGIVSGPSVELYGVVGIGGGNVQRDGFGEVDQVVEENEPAVIFQGGAGLRLYAFREAVALELELRDLFFPDPGEGGVTHSLQLQGSLRVSTDAAAWQARELADRPERSLENRLVLTPAAGVSLLDDLVTTRAVSLNVSYEIWDFLAVEALGAIMFATESALTKELLDRGRLTPSPERLAQLEWVAAAGLRVNALRGRFASLGLPIDGDLTLYLAGGAGIGHTRMPCSRQLTPCAAADDPDVFIPYESAGLEIVGHAGGGLRLQFFDMLALSFELRDFIFDKASRIVNTPLPPPPPNRVVTHVFLGQVGASVLFF